MHLKAKPWLGVAFSFPIRPQKEQNQPVAAGEGPKGGWQWHACLPTGKDQSRWLIRVGAGLDPSAPLSAHLLRWLVKQVLLTAYHAPALVLALWSFSSQHTVANAGTVC